MQRRQYKCMDFCPAQKWRLSSPEAFAHEDVPLKRVIEKLKPRRHRPSCGRERALGQRVRFIYGRQ